MSDWKSGMGMGAMQSNSEWVETREIKDATEETEQSAPPSVFSVRSVVNPRGRVSTV